MSDETDNVTKRSVKLRDILIHPEEDKQVLDSVSMNQTSTDDNKRVMETTFIDACLNPASNTSQKLKQDNLPQIVIDPASPRASITQLENVRYSASTQDYTTVGGIEPDCSESTQTTHILQDKDLVQSKHPVEMTATSSQPSTLGHPSVPSVKKRYDPILNKALLKAVSINNLEDVETALMCGADVQAQSPPLFISALHFAAWLGNQPMVEYLIAAGSFPNTKDIYGRTPLHLAAAMGHKECVLFLLEAGHNPNVCTKEIQPSTLIPTGIARVVISSSQTLKKWEKYEFDPYLDGFQMPVSDCGCRTPIHEAVKGNHPECVTLILAAGGNPNVIDSLGLHPLLLAGAGVSQNDLDAISRYEEVVSDLLGNGADATACHPGTGTSALHNAVTLGSLSSVVLLLAGKADISWSSSAGGYTTALHEAAGSGNVDILRLILLSEKDLEWRATLTNLVDDVGRTPLHRAANVGSRRCISLLLDHGANLSLRTKTGVTAMEALLHHVPRPKRFLFDVLNSRVHCNSASAEELGFMLYLDFGILAPDGIEKQTRVLNSIMNSKGVSKDLIQSLLGHPMVEAYVRLKWHSLKTLFFAVVAVYAVFVISLSTYITLEYLYPSENRSRGFHTFVLLMRYVHLAFAFIVLLNVFGQCVMNIKYYAKQFETWTNGMSAVLSIVWILTGDFKGMQSVVKCDWIKHFIAIAIPLSWIGLMLLLGRFPLWGSHALLFEAVLKNVLWTFIVLGCIVLGFSFSFFVQFHETQKAAFGNPWKAFVKTMVMMTGEYEYTSLFSNEKGDEKNVLLGTSRVTFLIFVVVASIVLVNLIVGLAVSDTQALRIEGQARCLHKRAEFVDLLECTVSAIVRRQALAVKASFAPNGAVKEKTFTLARHLPRRVLDALIDIAVVNRDSTQIYDGRRVDSWTSNFFNKGSPRNLETQVFNMLERFLRDITSVLASDGLNNSSIHASPNLSNLGLHVLRAHRAMRNAHSQSITSLAPPIWIPKPSPLKMESK